MFGIPKMAKHWVILAILAILGVPKKGTLGCPNQNSKIIFLDLVHPENPTYTVDTLGTQIGPRKVIFGHFIDFIPV